MAKAQQMTDKEIENLELIFESLDLAASLMRAGANTKDGDYRHELFAQAGGHVNRFQKLLNDYLKGGQHGQKVQN